MEIEHTSTRSRTPIHVVGVTRDTACPLVRCLVHFSACRDAIGGREGKMGERKGEMKVR